MRFRTGLGSLAACVALLAIPRSASAQLKVAVINLQQAILDSAELKKADSEFSAKYKPRQAEIDKVTADIAKIQQQLDTSGDTMAPQAAADLQAQLARKQRDQQRLNEDLQADTERDRNEVLSKSYQKMSGVLKTLAAERGYDLVLEIANVAYFFKDSLDITKDATAAYDKTYPVGAASPAPKK